MKKGRSQILNLLNEYTIFFLQGCKDVDNKSLAILDKATFKISNCQYKTDIHRELRKLRSKNIISQNDFVKMTDTIY